MATVFGKRWKSIAWSFAGISALCLGALAILVLGQSCAQRMTKQEVTGVGGKLFYVDILAPKDAYDLIQKNKDNKNFIILDVRTPEEFADGHIENAVNINFRSESFALELNKLDHNKTYFVYCRTGNRSYDAVDLMARFGFTSIVRLDGDITGWKSAKLPVAR
jgi:rhodanese-related sulfurtransferase